MSGSSGNAVRIENILFDCGVSYSKLSHVLPKVDYLIITHRHTDHLNITTFNKIREDYPYIKVITNHDVARLIKPDYIANANYTLKVNEYSFLPFECKHDVLNYGYVFKCKGNDVIYATDTADYENIPDQKYDYFFIESNYDENRIAMVKNVRHGRYSPYLSSTLRHASNQQAQAVYYCYRKGKDSEFIQLHMSTRFH